MAKYGGSHFPTLKIFPAGDAKDKPVVYKGGRTEKELTDFLNEHCGTFRAVGGGLNEKAGLVTEWDNRIHEYMHSTAEKAASIKRGLLREMRETDTEVGKLYLKALESLGTKDGEEWLDTEVKRSESHYSYTVSHLMCTLDLINLFDVDIQLSHWTIASSYILTSYTFTENM